MKALSIKQPWADAVVFGLKDIENRTWWTNHRGTLAIHASKGWDKKGEESLLAGKFDRRFIEAAKSKYRRGVVLGVVEVFSVQKARHCQSIWALGPWCWMLKNALAFTPICATGNLGLWTLEEKLEELVRKHMDLQGLAVKPK